MFTRLPRGGVGEVPRRGEKTPLEAVEDHEMMRFLELGLPVRVIPMSADSIPVDREPDIPSWRGASVSWGSRACHTDKVARFHT